MKKLRTKSYTIADEAEAHIKTILARQPHGPYMLGGCSASGIVAYEMAQRLRARGHEVGLLVLFDTPNPYFMREYSDFWMSVYFLSQRSEQSAMEQDSWMGGRESSRAETRQTEVALLDVEWNESHAQSYGPVQNFDDSHRCRAKVPSCALLGQGSAS